MNVLVRQYVEKYSETEALRDKTNATNTDLENVIIRRNEILIKVITEGKEADFVKFDADVLWKFSAKKLLAKAAGAEKMSEKYRRAAIHVPLLWVTTWNVESHEFYGGNSRS